MMLTIFIEIFFGGRGIYEPARMPLPITRLVMSLGAIKCYANGRHTGASGHE